MICVWAGQTDRFGSLISRTLDDMTICGNLCISKMLVGEDSHAKTAVSVNHNDHV